MRILNLPHSRWRHILRGLFLQGFSRLSPIDTDVQLELLDGFAGFVV